MLRSAYTLFFLFAFASFLSGCEDITNSNSSNTPLRVGEIMGDINRVQYRFTSKGRLTDDATNSYTPAARFINMYRELPSGTYGTIVLRLADINLDDLTLPHTPTKVKVTYSPRPNEPYEAADSGVTMQITSKDGDILKGVFSCNLKAKGSTSTAYELRNGEFAIQLIRN